MKIFNKITIFFLLFFYTGCTKVIYVPTQAETIIEKVDSLVYFRDTITIQVPQEIIKEVLPIIDTSKIETSVAKSTAYLDTINRKLIHTLQNKDTQLKSKIDTIVKVQYLNKLVEKEIIQEVPVEVPFIPNWGKYLIAYGAICAVWTIAKIWLKFKK
jgi:hypothetical protein